MAKIDVSKVAEILKKHQVAPAVMRQILEEINLATQPDPGDEVKPPALKKQFVIMISDPNGEMPETDLVGWVLQKPSVNSNPKPQGAAPMPSSASTSTTKSSARAARC
jgi:hypothetical protein